MAGLGRGGHAVTGFHDLRCERWFGERLEAGVCPSEMAKGLFAFGQISPIRSGFKRQQKA